VLELWVALELFPGFHGLSGTYPKAEKYSLSAGSPLTALCLSRQIKLTCGLPTAPQLKGGGSSMQSSPSLSSSQTISALLALCPLKSGGGVGSAGQC